MTERDVMADGHAVALDDFGLSAIDRNILTGVVRAHLTGYDVRVFGSRASGAHRRFSDLDLAVLGGPIAPETLRAARDALEYSRLSIKVDLVDWAATTPEFRAAVGSLERAPRL